MADQARKSYPAIQGLHWHRDQYYSFFIPNNWQKLEWADHRAGVIYAPDASDPLTVFSVDAKDLGTRIAADDLAVLAEGFFGTIEQLTDVRIESRDQKTSADRLELEAKYTFCEQDATRKRWARVFYHETRQIAMTAQGAAPEKYDYWLPWFFEAMMTARVHATKPESPI
jgi:hypothetical protein